MWTNANTSIKKITFVYSVIEFVVNCKSAVKSDCNLLKSYFLLFYYKFNYENSLCDN